jgi:hypothetical protein
MLREPSLYEAVGRTDLLLDRSVADGRHGSGCTSIKAKEL